LFILYINDLPLSISNCNTDSLCWWFYNTHFWEKYFKYTN
jgi:hypothetical protein